LTWNILLNDYFSDNVPPPKQDDCGQLDINVANHEQWLGMDTISVLK